MDRISLNKVIDRAITTQVRLQAARRELFYFMKKSESCMESSPDCSALIKELNLAKAESEKAIQNLNLAFQGDFILQSECQVR